MTRVIVIDDEHDITEVFSEFLKLKNIDVVAKGYNGKQAVELYKEHKPDLVLMDLVMPEFDGFYGLENIRKIDKNSKIVIFSASLTPEYIEKLRSMGVSGITRKPYDMDNVIEIIDKVLQGQIIDLTPI